MTLTVIGNGWSPEQPGGLNRYVTKLSGALEENGRSQRVLVLGPATSGLVEGLEVVAHRSDPLRTRLAGFRRSILRHAAGSDLVVVHFALNAVPLLSVRHLPPVVVHFHGPWADESRAMGEGSAAVRIKRRTEAAVYRRAQRVIVLSDAFKERVCRDYGVSPQRVEVVRPGVDLGRIPVRRGREAGRSFVCVRRLVPRMGIDVLLHAWARTDRRGWTLEIVGAGPEMQNLRELADRLRISAAVRFWGHVSDATLGDLYAAAVASIVPSVELEGFGLVALESLAAGTPVIASRTGGLQEFLGEVSPDWLVRPGSVDDLRTRLQSAIESPRTLLDPDACRKVAEEHSWGAAAHRVEKIYDSVLDAARRPRRAN